MGVTNLRLAVIGYGRHASFVLVPILHKLPVEIVAICDADRKRLEEYSRIHREVPLFTDYRDMLETARPEAVLIAVDPAIHFEAAKASLLAGCNVFVEKAPTRTADQARELAEIESRVGRWVMCGFNRRWATAYRMAAEIARRPALGGIRMYYAKYHAGEYGTEHRFIENHIIHHLDLMRFFLGGIEGMFLRRVLTGSGKYAYDLSFRAASGAIGTLQSASIQCNSYPQEYVEMIGDGWEVIVGNHQELQFNRDTRNAMDRLKDVPVALDDRLDTLIWNQNRTMFPPTLFADTGFEIELEHFVASCRNGTAPLWHAQDFVETMRLVEELSRLVTGAVHDR